MPTYSFAHGNHRFDSIKPIGTRSMPCKLCDEVAHYVPSFGVIPQVKVQWASEFYWHPDLKANHDEATGSFKEAREYLEEEKLNGLKV